MQVPLILVSAACLAAAAADDHVQSPPSLRGSRSLADVVENASQPEETSSYPIVAGEHVGAGLANETGVFPLEGNVSEDAVSPLVLLGSSGGWYQGGDKMWGGGAGLESISSGNVGYYDQGMAAAHARCGGAGCALIVNPPGHRTVNQFHIHFVHYAGYGSSLKRRLEGLVCGKDGWRGGSLPCGGKAAYFSGFPGVFSEAMTAGGFQHASVIAWPASCGGSGTIVELAYGCSIEHQIRGDYDPRYR